MAWRVVPGRVVLVVALLEPRQKFDGLKKFAAIIQLERQRAFANLARHLAVGVPVVLPQVGVGLLLHVFPADGNRAFADFALLVGSLQSLFAHLLGAALGIGERPVGQGWLVAAFEF